jgi:TorA maturation chaperone TorD
MALPGSALAPQADAAAAVAPLASPELADLFLVLAAAFAPPPPGLSSAAWCGSLADDLGELGAALALETSDAVAALVRAAAGPLGEEPWLVRYSRLFLVPPVTVTLNTGIYLEGGLGGTASQMMAQCYAVAGFERSESFRDLPDHVAIQLEFVAALLGRAFEGDPDSRDMASEYSQAFLHHWIDPLRRACERSAAGDPAAAAYAALAGVLGQAAQRTTA